MNNLTNTVVMVLWLTNAAVFYHPNGQDKWVTNTTFKVVIVPSLRSTNSMPVFTNVTRYGWTQVPLQEPRKPLDVRDGPPPLPPGKTPQ